MKGQTTFWIVAIIAVSSSPPLAAAESFLAYPAGITHLEVESHIDVVFREAAPDTSKPCSDPVNQPCETLVMRGTITVLRHEPRDTNDDSRFEITQEVIVAETHGHSAVLNRELVLRQSVSRRTLGTTVQGAPGVDFPADSTFAVFIEISAPGSSTFPTVGNTDPIQVSSRVSQIPPVGAAFAHKPGVATALRDETGTIRAWTTVGLKQIKSSIAQMPLIPAPGQPR